jgi:hypothetical protein
MADDDEAARRARAAALRQRIAGLKPGRTNPTQASENESESDQTDPGETVDQEALPGESPREFIHRRMRELDKKT